MEEKSSEEKQRKEESDVNVCERTGEHSRRNRPCRPCVKEEAL